MLLHGFEEFNIVRDNTLSNPSMQKPVQRKGKILFINAVNEVKRHKTIMYYPNLNQHNGNLL